MDDLVARFYQTTDYMNVSEGSKATYRAIIERFRAKHGSKRVNVGMKPRHIEAMMAEMFSTPNAANTMRKRVA
ncbi:MAG: hypothetical protein NTX73_08410 [Rhodobacterales bacterium]|nr:hypothetical protein [Rhodobacterales bacterium]